MAPNTNRHIVSKCNKSKTNSSPFPSEVIAKLETTLSTAQQNKEQTQNAQNNGCNIKQWIDNNRITALEWTAAEALDSAYVAR